MRNWKKNLLLKKKVKRSYFKVVPLNLKKGNKNHKWFMCFKSCLIGTEGKWNKKWEHLDIWRGGTLIGVSCSTEDPRSCLSFSVIANSVIGNYVQYVNNRIQSIQDHKTTTLVTEYDAGKRDCRTTHVWEMIPFSSSTWWEELSLSNNTVINWSVIRVTASFSCRIGGRLSRFLPVEPAMKAEQIKAGY